MYLHLGAQPSGQGAAPRTARALLGRARPGGGVTANDRAGVDCWHCRSSLWRSHGEGDRSLKASGGGAATSRHSPSSALWTAASPWLRSEEHTSELQSLMRISYAVFCLKKKQLSLQSPVTQLIPTPTNTIAT